MFLWTNLAALAIKHCSLVGRLDNVGNHDMSKDWPTKRSSAVYTGKKWRDASGSTGQNQVGASEPQRLCPVSHEQVRIEDKLTRQWFPQTTLSQLSEDGTAEGAATSRHKTETAALPLFIIGAGADGVTDLEQLVRSRTSGGRRLDPGLAVADLPERRLPGQGAGVAGHPAGSGAAQ